MKHLAWDEGSVHAALGDVFGEGVRRWLDDQQKTSKTYCGIRVSMTKIDNDHFDCPACQARKAEDLELSRSYNAGTV